MEPKTAFASTMTITIIILTSGVVTSASAERICIHPSPSHNNQLELGQVIGVVVVVGVVVLVDTVVVVPVATHSSPTH